jgi:tetratricopeptide (TPR) repeat protein
VIGPLIDQGLLHSLEGEWDAAYDYLQEAKAVAEQGEDLWGRRLAAERLARLDLLQGHPQAAVERLTPLLDRPGLEEIAVTPLLPVLAEAYLELGDVASAERIAAEAIRRSRARGNALHLVFALDSRARILMHQQEWVEAERTLQELLSLTRAMPYPYGEAEAVRDLGVVYVRKGHLDEGRRRMEEALGIFQQLGAMKDIERTCAALGDLG